MEEQDAQLIGEQIARLRDNLQARFERDEAALIHQAQLTGNKLEALVGTSATLLEGGGSGLEACEINLVNLTGSPVACKLFHSEGTPTDDSTVFGLAGGTLPANEGFQWQGKLSLAVSGVYAQAGSANAIAALVTVRSGAGMVRA